MKTFDVRVTEPGYELAVFWGTDHVAHKHLPDPDNDWEKCFLGVRAKKPAYFLPYDKAKHVVPRLFDIREDEFRYLGESVRQEVPEFGGYIAVVHK